MRLALSLLALPALLIGNSASAQNAAAGATLFKTRCSTCHGTAGEGRKGLGPSLKGLVGRKSGSVPDFKYSPALTKAALTWTPANLDSFITAPMKKVPGTRMVIAVPDAKQRGDLLAFLATLK